MFYGRTKREVYRYGLWDGIGLVLAIEAGIVVVVLSTLAIAAG